MAGPISEVHGGDLGRCPRLGLVCLVGWAPVPPTDKGLGYREAGCAGGMCQDGGGEGSGSGWARRGQSVDTAGTDVRGDEAEAAGRRGLVGGAERAQAVGEHLPRSHQRPRAGGLRTHGPLHPGKRA